jgi:hypothetical protein
LQRIAAVGGAISVVPLIGPSPSLLATQQSKPNPNYFVGTLVTAGPNFIVLQQHGRIPDIARIEIGAETDICRRGCGANWSTLRIGDRIATNTHVATGGRHVANWVQANGIADWGIVESVAGAKVIVEPMPEMSRVARELLVEPYTRLYSDAGDRQGSALILRHADVVYFTGAGAGPDFYAESLWAFTIHVTSHGYRK